MPFKAPEQAKCPKCGKSVYAAEERLAAGHKWHKMCLKCGLCDKMLDSTTVAEHEGLVYCKVCHAKKFGPKGYGFGGGAGALSTETGAQHGNLECEMGNRPTGAHIGPSAVVEGGCPRCGARVYEAEKATAAGIDFHKTCFSCKSCSKKLDSTTVCDKEREIYCKACYAKAFGPHGKV
ncbi:muscle LIM protein 1-like [Lineus longissimus]|uniref:muscle LIM protein 1-like n=1 Tax=Lineus longissimus TaxID=88925 RepID=UPI002B4CBF99